MKKTVTTTVKERFEPDDEMLSVSVTLIRTGPVVSFTLHPWQASLEEARELWSLLGRALDAVDGKVGPA